MKEPDEMTVRIRKRIHYRTTEACKIAGISRSTLLRWFRNGTLKDETQRDRRGWRLFTQANIDKIIEESNKEVEKKVSLDEISNL